MPWVTVALAQTDSPGDTFEGEILSVPILLGFGALAARAWSVYQSASVTESREVSVVRPTGEAAIACTVADNHGYMQRCRAID